MELITVSKWLTDYINLHIHQLVLDRAQYRGWCWISYLAQLFFAQGPLADFLIVSHTTDKTNKKTPTCSRILHTLTSHFTRTCQGSLSIWYTKMGKFCISKAVWLVLRGQMCAKKTFPTPPHHHHQPDLLIQCRFTSSNLYVGGEIEIHPNRWFPPPPPNCQQFICPELVLTDFCSWPTGAESDVIFCCSTPAPKLDVHSEILFYSPRLERVVIWVPIDNSHVISLINKAFPLTELFFCLFYTILSTLTRL